MDEARLRRYEPLWNSWYIDGLIGTGSFGSVYRIKREEFGITQYSALKIISIPSEETEIKKFMAEGMTQQETKSYYSGIVEDIYTEIGLMSQLKGNSNIVSYEDHQTIERQEQIGFDIFIRMELLKGLRDYVIEHNMTKRKTVKLGIDICKALVLCEKYNILHRDIKPDNIFISKDENFKLGDFGIARKVENYQMGLSIKGSYEYMAPEVYQGKAYDARVDIYSLGIVLYTYLNNFKTPFLNPDNKSSTYSERQEALKRRLKGEELPAPINADEKLSEIILKAIRYNPEERYKNAEEFLNALLTIEEKELEVETNCKEADLDKTIIIKENQIDAEVSSIKQKSLGYSSINQVNVEDGTIILNMAEQNALKNEENCEVDQCQTFTTDTLGYQQKSSENPTVYLQNTYEDITELSLQKNKKLVWITIATIVIGVGGLCIGGGIFFRHYQQGKTDTVLTNSHIIKQIEEIAQSIVELCTESQKPDEEITYKGDGKDFTSIMEIDKLKQEEVKNVISVSLDRNQIKTLSGIEKFFNLKELMVSNNNINDISALEKNTSLESLMMDNNNIRDLSAVENLILLENLTVSKNQLSDISVLKYCKKLKNLDLSYNVEISDISALKKLKQLEFVGLEGTSVTKEDVEDLKRSIPDCCIIWDGGVV